MKNLHLVIAGLALSVLVTASPAQARQDRKKPATKQFNDWAGGKGTSRSARGTQNVRSAYANLGKNSRAEVGFTDRERTQLKGTWRRETANSATIRFTGSHQGQGRATFNQGHLQTLKLSGRDQRRQPFGMNFQSNERPWQGGNRPPNWEDHTEWDRHPAWQESRWNDRTVITQWNGTQSGQGHLDFDNRQSQHITRVTVDVQRNREASIKLQAEGRDLNLYGRATKQGNVLMIAVRDSESRSGSTGTVRVYLNQRYGEFVRVTGDGRTNGRHFTFAFNRWN